MSILCKRVTRSLMTFVVRDLVRRSRQCWSESPLTSKPMGDEATYQSLWEAAKEMTYPTIDEFVELQPSDIDNNFLDDLALHTQICIKSSELCYQHGRVLYSVLRGLIAKLEDGSDGPLTIFETGTARGFSSICMSKALQDANTAGQIVTLDILPHRKQIFWNIIDDCDGKKTREQLLHPWKQYVDGTITFLEGDSQVLMRSIDLPRVHFAFLDGGHNYQHVGLEFDYVQQRQKEGEIIVFDDYTPGMFDQLVRAVDEGCDRFKYSKKPIIVDDNRGYVVATKLPTNG